MMVADRIGKEGGGGSVVATNAERNRKAERE